MKVYKFFKIPNNKYKIDEDIERKYTLYAITNNKEYAKRFKEDRNMEKFIYMVNEDVDKEEYAEMCNEARGAVLEMHTLTTIFDNNHTRKHAVKKDVLMTYFERQLITEPDTLLDDEGFWQCMPYPLILKPKYVKALNAFEFINYYKLMTTEYLPMHLCDKLMEMIPDDDYSAPSIEFDEVALFIRIIQDTL